MAMASRLTFLHLPGLLGDKNRKANDMKSVIRSQETAIYFD